MRRTLIHFATLVPAVLTAVMIPAFPEPVEGAVEVGLQSENVVIVVNDAVPESVKLGEYYARKRSIPADNICHLKTVDTEVVTREAYNETIETPIREFLGKRLGQMRVKLPEGELVLKLAERQARCLVTTWGVPLKIDGYVDTQEMFKSMAAGVDSELALLPQGSHILNGARPNPYYGQDHPFDGLLARQMLMVCRLDGPSPDVVRRMIDDAVYAEEHGLQGRAYFDIRSTSKPGYVEGDRWIKAAFERVKLTGLPSYLDTTAEMIPVEYPMPEAVFYLGWYHDVVSGPMSRKDFVFARGAVAYHLHSFAAWTVRTTSQRWAGPLLSKGAACTLGSVYEPFLLGSPQLDIFADRLCQGYTFAEASYMSQRLLSWMATFLGDPLYRPFAKPVRPPTGAAPPPLPQLKGPAPELPGP